MTWLPPAWSTTGTSSPSTSGRASGRPPAGQLRAPATILYSNDDPVVPAIDFVGLGILVFNGTSAGGGYRRRPPFPSDLPEGAGGRGNEAVPGDAGLIQFIPCWAAKVEK